MSKLANNVPFGGILSSKMKQGDLVSWSEWLVEDKKLLEHKTYGTILSIDSKVQGHRDICIIKVVCSETGLVLEMDAFQIRIEETN